METREEAEGRDQLVKIGHRDSSECFSKLDC